MKFITKKLSMAALITSTLMLSGCGSSNTEKPTEEPAADVEKQDEIPFEKMTEEEMNVLVAGDVVTKLPDSEYLNTMGLDFIYFYNTWDKVTGEEYPSEPESYFTDIYIKNGELTGSDYIEKFELKEILIGPMEYNRIEETGRWVKTIGMPSGEWFMVENIPQEKNDELEKKYKEFNK